MKLKSLVLFPCMFTQSRRTAWISQSALPLLCVVTVISTVSHSSLDRATLNYTLVTDCSQSVKRAVNRNDVGQPSVSQSSRSRTYIWLSLVEL